MSNVWRFVRQRPWTTVFGLVTVYLILRWVGV